jgi:glucoamylase
LAPGVLSSALPARDLNARADSKPAALQAILNNIGGSQSGSDLDGDATTTPADAPETADPSAPMLFRLLHLDS